MTKSIQVEVPRRGIGSDLTEALAVLSQLGARANWHRVAREWMYGDAPVTELGAAEAEFYAS